MIHGVFTLWASVLEVGPPLLPMPNALVVPCRYFTDQYDDVSTHLLIHEMLRTTMAFLWFYDVWTVYTAGPVAVYLTVS